MLEVSLTNLLRVIDEPVLQHPCFSRPAMRVYLRFGRIFSQIRLESRSGLGNFPTMQLDNPDLAILRLLQRDASMSIAQIADSVNLSQNACWRRIKRMEDEGVIQKRVALL